MPECRELEWRRRLHAERGLMAFRIALDHLMDMNYTLSEAADLLMEVADDMKKNPRPAPPKP